MCAGALTATTAGAGEIAWARPTSSLVGGVEHMGHHPMGAEVDFNPRFVAERIVDESRRDMGATAENLHDRFPQLTKEDADAYAVASQRRAAAAWDDGVMDGIVVPMSVFTDDGLDGRRPRRVPAAGHDARGPRRRCGRRSAPAAGSPRATRPG